MLCFISIHCSSSRGNAYPQCRYRLAAAPVFHFISRRWCRARCGGLRAGDPGTERGRCLHPGMFGLEVDYSFASRRVTRVLDAIVAERGQPLAIRCDNGVGVDESEFSGVVCGVLDSSWCTFNRGNRRRTRTWKAFTGGCGKNV